MGTHELSQSNVYTSTAMLPPHVDVLLPLQGTAQDWAGSGDFPQCERGAVALPQKQLLPFSTPAVS
jgi:hypothetical protein